MAQIILDSNNNLIQGDFDNATLNNRTKLQTTTTNATTNVYAVPNGSSTSAGYSVSNNSSLTNCSKIVMATNGSTDTQIISGVNGSGTYLPMSFYVNNTLALQISTAGVVTAPYGGFSGAGMTLLGTLTTTSGTTQTLSGLTLTNYKILQISMNNVGFSSADTNQALRLAGVNILRPVMNNIGSGVGFMFLDLASGGFNGGTYIDTYSANSSDYAFSQAGNLSSITTSTTSLSFTWTSGQAFTRGTIKVYGVS